MKVFKFGGASINDAIAVKNTADIIKLFPNENILIVISAMGKTTNAFEILLKSYFNKLSSVESDFKVIKEYHFSIVQDLFADPKHPVYKEIEDIFLSIQKYLQNTPTKDYDFEYDQLVSFGEILSSKIAHHYLISCGVNNKWIDIRDVLKTDASYREAKVDWESTSVQMQKIIVPLFKQKSSIAITQGFIASSNDNHTTTLGREGSDYTAAICAHILSAEEIIIWKDVPGVLNADPKFFKETTLLSHISYAEAIELAYYGASIIHPKTIQPLQNKNIPLRIKSFLNPDGKGSLIDSSAGQDHIIPTFISKINQVLISISSKDFAFIAEQNLHDIFGLFAQHRIKVNLMQNSAISFSVCVDNDEHRIPLLLSSLKKNYTLKYNDNLQLITIRHYDQPTIDAVVGKRKILLEQKSRSTVQLVVK